MIAGDTKVIKYRAVWPISLAALTLFPFSVQQTNERRPYPLEYPAYFGGRINIPEDNPTTQEGVYLGRALFYEPLLSKNNQISCASCHEQKLAFTDGKAFSMGVDGKLTNRNSMSLANLLWVRNLFWDGRSKSLEEQAEFPLTDPHEMGQPIAVSIRKLQQTATYPPLFEAAFGDDRISENNLKKALAQFQRTLISSGSAYDRFLQNEYNPTDEELRGMELFMTAPQPGNNIRGANCGHCHGTPKTFIELFHNNGLDSIPRDPGRFGFTGRTADEGRFRVPTLRNIALTAPYMHDGRFETLEEVLDHYSDQVRESPSLSPFISGISNKPEGRQLALTKEEKSAILSFLNMLTDSVFINNPEFSDPHPLPSM